MTVTVFGNGTVTGISAGGLPDGCIQSADLASGTGGKVLQVLTATDSTSRSTTGTSFVTGSNSLSVDMTLASTANKVLIICSLAVATNTANGQAIYTIYKDSTNIGPAAGFVTHYANMGTITNPYRSGASMVTLYSPSSTSTITYQVYMKSNGVGTIYINQTSTTSTITVLEIEG
tara:strand:- start:266 stop:790 length:525 start_codon:yes stop_codon:yes gene_type:complete